MQRLLAGIRHFQSEVFPHQREHFEKLGGGQSPETLFITCSDSRINPHLLTQSEAGELFVLRNAGNLVANYGGGSSAEAATIEFSVKVLRVKHIVICGHSKCGAMKALLEPEGANGLPAVKAWLQNAHATEEVVRESCPGLTGESLLDATIKANVVVQLNSLLTHPPVAAKLSSGSLQVHGWVYQFETGEVDAYHPDTRSWAPLS